MLNSFWAAFEETFAKAAELDFPPFLGPVPSGTPLNSTPYVAHLDDVVEGGIMSNRRELLRQLVVAVEELAKRGVESVAVLLGGSAVGPKPYPADLDCVLFYRLDQASPATRAPNLAGFQRRMKARRLDLRLVPADGDPLLLIKAVSFFTTLYAMSEASEPVRGLVLIDCRPRPPAQVD
jgi:hypothetical protein